MSWKPDHPRVWDEAIDRFTSAYPHIKVVREIAPHSSTAYHDLLTQKLKNRDLSVDLFFMDVVWIAEFAAAGWALPIDEVFPPSERERFLPATIQAGTYERHVYGVPSRIDGGMLYYRADLLDKYGLEPPTTWEDLARQADEIVRGEAADQPALRGYVAQFKQYEGLVCNMLEFVGSNDGGLLNEEGTQSTLSTPEALASVEFVRDSIIRRLASPAVLTYQEPESLAVFVQGKAVFHRNWPYAWEVANNPDRSRIAGKVGVVPLPNFAGSRSVSALGGWLFGISAYSQHPLEAWQFISFLTSYDLQKHFAILSGIAPSRIALYSDAEVLTAAPQFRNLYAVFQSTTPRPRSPLYPAVSNVLQRYFSRALAFTDLDLRVEAAIADRQINRLLALTRSNP
ncbi:MAG: ABC transporter substrate-binding protein [Nitrospiraceae bacterium]